ncbi:hypothetical protein QTG54_010203 [Skeletonema marinoi]|uniref:Uncharacterized protein n=1 Tax=Skeletonema marinoi TaxID=267567 RepID=A0AAD8Y3N6_9STRA|nr:hypothetical protein QTG54_010203 [Skeletonema marinoi]
MASMQHPIVGDYMHGDKGTITRKNNCACMPHSCQWIHSALLQMMGKCYSSEVSYCYRVYTSILIEIYQMQMLHHTT